MVDFVDCYFCGTVGNDLEQHPVIPPETDPSADHQRRVVVCPTCREKLDRVIEPVIEHFDASAGDRPGEASPETGQAASPEDAAAEPDGSEGDAKADGSDEQTDATAAREVTEDPTEETWVMEETGKTGESEGADETSETEESERDEAEESETDKVEESGGADETDETEASVELPAETQQILQLLGNREFPVDHDEIVTVATNAYGVGFEEAEAVIDVLLQQGRLREEDGTLYRPDRYGLV
jgi:hypothetical protein